MDPYRVPKEPSKVLLEVPPDPPVERILFLSDVAERHRGAETVSDLLSSPAKFLPVLVEGDGMLLLRKDAVRWVKVLDPTRGEWLYLEEREGAQVLRVRCVFSEGDILEGEIWALTPEGERRVSDVVNHQVGFLPLETPEGLYLLNLNRVHTIRLLEENHGGPR